AISFSNNKFILTTDADCEVPEKWLQEFDEFLQKNSVKMLAGPVKIAFPKKGFLKLFQELDFLSLQAASIGSFGIEKAFLCNGANLCYEKESFLKLNGFEGNEHFAGGDDIFLLEKFETAGMKTAFLKSKSAVVSTSAQLTIKSLFSQRIRWAGKTSAVDGIGKWVGLIVFLMNFSLILGLFLVLFGILQTEVFFIFFLLKFNVDFILIYRSAIFFEKENIMKNYFWCSFLYPFFCTAVVFLSLIPGFYWKGRHFSK
ncbi:MAG TPA: glycosyltransferase family 2 protein, partial [Salinimicrobium sp.]|nr:glycosyltransferase family 2 protein [Salinimicrobium sp.]